MLQIIISDNSFAHVFFFVVYSVRLLENIFILGIEIPPNNEIVILLFIFTTLIPSILLPLFSRQIKDEDLSQILSMMAVIFLIGIFLNREALSSTSDNRMLLHKVNPISLAYTASSFLIFFALRFSSSNLVKIQSIISVPFLLWVFVFARSRGAIIACSIALLIYFLFLKGGSQRFKLIIVSVISLSFFVYFLDPAYIEVILDSLSRVDSRTDMSTLGRVLAFSGAWSQFLEDPFFGKYTFEFQTMYYPHNIFLESLMSVGIFGTIPFVIHFLLAFRAAVGLILYSGRSFAEVFICIIFFRDAVGAMASGAIWSASGVWVTSALVISIWYGKLLRQNASFNAANRKHRWQGRF